MKTLSVLTLALLVSLPAMAEEAYSVSTRALTEQLPRPAEHITDAQQAALQDAVARQDTEQKTPPNFQPKAGDKLPLSMTLDVLPSDVMAREPSIAPFAYAKLAKNVLVIDPMDRKIVAVLPRPDPNTVKDPTPVEWAQTRGRELTGQAPQEPASNVEAPQPAGDSGDKKNGSEEGRIEK